ncbi:hypothetical protein JB92DRAFT_3130061 [Gautieria morchelliformis]|nr:hypothetical protein JB92DRAFT_3130061 [Gautieria morchelliformis]
MQSLGNPPHRPSFCRSPDAPPNAAQIPLAPALSTRVPRCIPPSTLGLVSTASARALATISRRLPLSRNLCATSQRQSLAIRGPLRRVQSPTDPHYPLPIPVLSRHPALTCASVACRVPGRAAPFRGYPISNLCYRRSPSHTFSPNCQRPLWPARHPSNQLVPQYLLHLYRSPPTAPKQYSVIFVVESHASSRTL